MTDTWTKTSFVVTIVRHGETDYNLSKVVKPESEIDLSLNETGVKQARQVAERLKWELFDKVFTSGLLRTQETMKIILNHIQTPPTTVTTDHRIRERDLGTMLTGTPVSDWVIAGIKWSMETKQSFLHYNPEGAEPYEEFKNRTASFFNELVSEESGNQKLSENILVVSHGLWIAALLDHIIRSEHYDLVSEGSVQDIKKQVDRAIMTNTSITQVRIGRHVDSDGKRKFQILNFNDNSHTKV